MVRGRRGAGAREKWASAVAGLWAAAAGVEVESARAQGAPIALTAELQANQFTTGAQSSPSVGMRDDDVHVVVWVSAGQDGDDDGIVQRKFASDGSFVVAFVAADGNGTGTFAQRFDADAQPVSAPIPVPESTANDYTSTSIGVAWQL